MGKWSIVATVLISFFFSFLSLFFFSHSPPLNKWWDKMAMRFTILIHVTTTPNLSWSVNKFVRNGVKQFYHSHAPVTLNVGQSKSLWYETVESSGDYMWCATTKGTQSRWQRTALHALTRCVTQFCRFRVNQLFSHFGHLFTSTELLGADFHQKMA